MDKTAIVILHYRGEEDTITCLNSILINHANSRQIQIIVVINPADGRKSSQHKDSFVSRLKHGFPSIHIIENDKNTGFAGGNNIGIKKALEIGCEYILLLNNDTVVSLEFLKRLVSFAKSDQNIGVVSPKIYFAKGFEYHKERYSGKELGKVIWYGGGTIDWANMYASHRGVDEVDTGQYNQIAETDFATGCCMLLSKNTVKNIGFFDEQYFLYYEDVDYSQRVRKSKMKVVYFPKTFIWHKNASSSGKPGSPLHVYYQNRNRLYFGFKYAPVLTKKSLFLDSIKLLLRGGAYTRSIIDYYIGRMGESGL